MASAVYGKPLAQINDGERFVGKTLVLGSGYGLGWVRLQMDLNAKQVPTSEEEARQYTAGYRRRFSKVTIWWQTIIGLFRWVLDGNDPALNSAGRKRQPLRGGMTFGLEGKNDVYIELGTGNRIWYRDCKVEIKPAPWNIDEEIEVITARNTNSDSSRYDVTHSILAENICSATAREIMSRGMLRCEQAGYPVILSVHDEVVLEVEKGYGSLDDVDTLLCQPLFFCEDLPLATESIRSPRYRK
jgi:DNA polymerase